MAVAASLDPRRRAELGQYMTPAPICRFMAGLFRPLPKAMRILDPGAGIGGLTVAIAERLSAEQAHIDFVGYEVDAEIATCLERTLDGVVDHCRAMGIDAAHDVRQTDFILAPPVQLDLLSSASDGMAGFSHVIMNPPYRKIASASRHRAALRQAGIETSNLYAGFLYIGDTGSKVGHFAHERLAALGVTVDRHGKMPDVVLHDVANDWLVLVEAVASHGPVDAKHHAELASLMAKARPGIVYVTAFPSRRDMTRHLSAISWETEVWCADAPSHMIHFDGKRYLGPYAQG